MWKVMMTALMTICGLASIAGAQASKPVFRTGVDVNYALNLEAKGKRYATAAGAPGDVFQMLANAGADSMRVRLWTGDEGMNGLTYATETARRAQAVGLKPYLVIFLSDNWADMVKQPVPAIWKDLDEPATLAAVEVYADRVTRHFTDAGIKVDFYEIGNEIDFGICGVFEEEWPKRVSRAYMETRIWSRMVPILSAAQKGVRKSQPDAKFMLHLAQWADPDYCIAFWEYMLTNGVAVDLPGLSYFPTSAKTGENGLATFEKHIATVATALKCPVTIVEHGYPSSPNFIGQFADWNKPIDGYSLDETGQAQWLKDFLTATRVNEHVNGVYYWSPEWTDNTMWDAFALFDANGNARPALTSFRR